MSDALNCDVLGWAELDAQQVELLPARTVLSAFGPCHSGGAGDDGGTGGDGGHDNTGGKGEGGDGGDATAVVAGNENYGFLQINIAIAEGGAGGDGYGGDVDASGGDGGEGGTDKK